jgi:hypothetical protein
MFVSCASCTVKTKDEMQEYQDKETSTDEVECKRE